MVDVQEALEPLIGQLKMGKAIGPDSVHNEILRGAGQNFVAIFCRPRGCGCYRKVLPHDDTSAEAGEEAPGSGQRMGESSSGRHAGQASRRVPSGPKKAKLTLFFFELILANSWLS